MIGLLRYLPLVISRMLCLLGGEEMKDMQMFDIYNNLKTYLLLSQPGDPYTALEQKIGLSNVLSI